MNAPSLESEPQKKSSSLIASVFIIVVLIGSNALLYFILQSKIQAQQRELTQSLDRIEAYDTQVDELTEQVRTLQSRQ